jgi:hypothetical protein
VQAERIEKILADTRVSMEMEGFVIGESETETSRKMLRGEISIEAVIDSYKQKARGYANDLRVRRDGIRG